MEKYFFFLNFCKNNSNLLSSKKHIFELIYVFFKHIKHEQKVVKNIFFQ